MRHPLDSKRSNLSYRASKTSRITPLRLGLGGSGDAHTKQRELWEMREYARMLDRDNVIAHAILDRSTEAVIGEGINVQIQSSSKRWTEKAERMWQQWWDQGADARGMSRGWELEQFAYRSYKCDGDILIVKESNGTISLIEGDRIGTPPRLENNPNIHAGVEYNDVGKITKFYICSDMIDPKQRGKTCQNYTSRPAKDCLWLANRHRPSMTRGVTAFASSMQLYEDIDAFLESCIINAKMSVAHVLFITRENGLADLDGTEEADDDFGNTRTEQTVSPGTILYGKPGEKGSMVGSTQPMINFSPFMKQLLRFAGVNFGLPLEVVALDFSDTNYSSARAAMQVADKSIKRNHKFMVDNFTSPLVRWKIEGWIREGKLPRPKFYKAQATPPRQISIDPNKEIQAEIAKTQSGFSTNKNVCSMLQQDYTDIFVQRSREIEDALAMAVKIDPTGNKVSWKDFLGHAKDYDSALYQELEAEVKKEETADAD